MPTKFYVVSKPNVGTDMPSTYRIERDRGVKEYRPQLVELRKKWPLAFPVNDQDVRPLALDAPRSISAVMGMPRFAMGPRIC